MCSGKAQSLKEVTSVLVNEYTIYKLSTASPEKNLKLLTYVISFKYSVPSQNKYGLPHNFCYTQQSKLHYEFLCIVCVKNVTRNYSFLLALSS
jgi:hypothetical protein